MFRWWAFWRRVEYGTGLLIILGLFGYGYYVMYVVQDPTCFDMIQNGSERGIDCGGACVRMCVADLEPITVKWAESFKIVDGQYNAVAYIENKNPLAGTPEAHYSFKLYDDAGLIVERNGVTQIQPSTTFPLFEGKIVTGTRIPTRTELEFIGESVWLPELTRFREFNLISQQLIDVDSAPRLTAKFENSSLDEVSNVEIIATIFDSSRNPLTASRTSVQYFKGRSTQDVVFTWPQPIAKTLRSCEIPTDVILAIDLSGSMNDDGGTPPEPISSVLKAAQSFVTRLNAHDAVGLVTYATDATLVEYLMSDSRKIAERISGLDIATAEERGSTNTGDAFKRIREEMGSARHNANARKVAILLTDGLANAPGDAPEAYALEEAQKLKDLDVQVFTIGLGEKLNEAFLKSLASTPAQYFKAPSVKEVDSIYTQITKEICEDGPTIIEIIPKVKATFPSLR